MLARLTDVTRHYRALEVATQEFGEGFDRTEFVQASESDEPVALNHVKAVERRLDQLFNYMADLAALGLELAEVRQSEAAANTREDFRRMRDLGVLAGEACGQLVRVAAIRNRMVHDYVARRLRTCTRRCTCCNSHCLSCLRLPGLGPRRVRQARVAGNGRGATATRDALTDAVPSARPNAGRFS